MTGSKHILVFVMSLPLACGPVASQTVDPATAEEVLVAGHYAEAVELARKEVAAAPDKVQAWWVLGRALEAVGRYREALDVYRWGGRFRGDFGVRLEVARARMERLLGQTDDADGRLRRVVRGHDPDDSALTSGEIAAVAEAARTLAVGDATLYRRALRLYEQALRIDPENQRARIALADLLLDRYNNTEAQALYREALGQDAQSPDALLGLARSFHFDHSVEAINVVRQALALRPDWEPALVFEARLLLELEEYDEASNRLDRALAANDASTQALTFRAALHYLRDQRGKFDEVVARLREVAPGYAGLYSALAEIAAQNRRYRDAVKFARMGVASAPRSWRARALLGINRLRLGQMETGRANLETAFEGDPYNVWVRNTLDLLDRMRSFEAERRGRFLLVGEERDVAILGPVLLPLAEQAFDEFARRYGVTPPTPIRIELFPRREDFSVRTVGLVGVDLLGVAFGPVVILGSPSSGEFGTTNIASTLWHELAHSFHLWMSAHRTSRWFTEGLAVLEEHRAGSGWGADPTPSFLRSYASGGLRPPSELNRSFIRPVSNEELAHAYFQGYLVLDLIESAYGEAAVRALIEGYGEGREPAELFAAVLGIDAQGFDRQFDDYVRLRFGRAIKALEPAADGAEPPFLASWHAARLALRSGDLDRALQLAEEARAMFPGFASEGSPYHILVEVHRQRGDVEAGTEALHALLRVNADDWAAHIQLAELHRSQQRPEHARRVWESALLIDPFDLALRSNLAASYESAGNWRLAVRERRAVLRLEPDDPVEARFRLALALTEDGKLDEAREEVLDTLESAPLYEAALELLLRIREESSSDS